MPALHISDTRLRSIGGTGVSPVPAQAKAYGYKKLNFEGELV